MVMFCLKRMSTISVLHFLLREMLTSPPETLVKETKIEILHWGVMKSGMSHFMKVKKLLFLI